MPVIIAPRQVLVATLLLNIKHHFFKCTLGKQQIYYLLNKGVYR